MLQIEDTSVKVLNQDLVRVSAALTQIWEELSTSKSKRSATIRGLLYGINTDLQPVRAVLLQHIRSLPECKVCGEEIKFDGTTHICKPYEE